MDAFIDLVLEGPAAPSPDDIADRAGVSRATFFRYFSTLDELRGEVATRVLERFPELFDIPELGRGTLESRIDRFVEARVQLHESLQRLELLMRAHAASDAGTSDFVDATRLLLADQAREHFDSELRSCGRALRDDIVTSIAVLTSVESWQQFRRSHGRSPAQTRQAWRTALAGILAESQAHADQTQE